MATHNRSATVTHRAKARRREWRAATGDGDIAPYRNGVWEWARGAKGLGFP